MFNDGKRSKKKGDAVKENRRGAILANGQKAGASCSDVNTTSYKSPSETGVCGSIDEQMLRKMTVTPAGMDKNEWLASHILSLFENVNALCGTLSELCTPVSCPVMSYPGVQKVQWVDERKKHHAYSAMQYIDCVMTFCEKTSKDEQLFPTKYGNSFSGNFEFHCRQVARYLWHCCGHLYSKHWDQLTVLNLRPQCSLVLGHLHMIAKLYGLLDSKDLTSLSHTTQLVSNFSQNGTASSNAAGIVGGTSRTCRLPSSKSGSWGGHPTPAVLAAKPYAHTC
uniref:Mob1/phocein family protein n=1 Tax=Syphacia muris TaxID=451379 RepID=A0A0N5AEX5_9BILA